MIAGVRGVIESTGPDWVHLQIGGVMLQVYVPGSAIPGLGDVGESTYLHTHLRIRDDQPVLYGFPTAADLELFTTLLGISGVGPRHSLSLLSGLGGDGLRRAIAEGDVTALGGVTGVGRRTASRIVLDLKGKLEVSEEAPSAVAPDRDAEVVAALTALGYSASEARQAVGKIEKSPEQPLEERVRQALRQFGGGG